MSFRPLHDRVPVQRFDAAAKTAACTIIPGTARNRHSGRRGSRQDREHGAARWTHANRKEIVIWLQKR